MDVLLFDRGDPRLGRHQIHDPRSRSYALPAARAARTVLHQRHAPIWDQGAVGSCTAHAAAGCLVTGPLYRPADTAWTEPTIQGLYSQETMLDDTQIPGHWPPTDTGSCGLWSAVALRTRGLLASWRSAFSTAAALAALEQQPLSIGVPWYRSMMDAGPGGRVVVDARSGVAGGHQVCLDGVDVNRRLVRFAQSWGAGWGDHGWGWIRFSDLDFLLRQGGDVTAFAR